MRTAGSPVALGSAGSTVASPPQLKVVERQTLESQERFLKSLVDEEIVQVIPLGPSRTHFKVSKQLASKLFDLKALEADPLVKPDDSCEGCEPGVANTVCCWGIEDEPPTLNLVSHHRNDAITLLHRYYRPHGLKT